ncbi:MAG: hypothetical protein RLZZ338_578, partial [Cyanobacteriota bacterium]
PYKICPNSPGGCYIFYYEIDWAIDWANAIRPYTNKDEIDWANAIRPY